MMHNTIAQATIVAWAIMMPGYLVMAGYPVFSYILMCTNRLPRDLFNIMSGIQHATSCQYYNIQAVIGQVIAWATT